MKPLITTLIFIFSIFNIDAQTVATSAQNNSNLTIHNNGSMSVFGNFYNSASVGNVNLKQGGLLYFYGDSLSNTAEMLGNGSFIFKGPRPAPYLDTFAQKVHFNGHANSIGDVIIDNDTHVLQDNSIGHIRDTFQFLNGYWNINDADLTVGDSDTGVLLGFTENKYFYTIGTGKLYREAIDNNKVIFPVGTVPTATNNSYLPAAIQNAGTTDKFGGGCFLTF